MSGSHINSSILVVTSFFNIKNAMKLKITLYIYLFLCLSGCNAFYNYKLNHSASLPICTFQSKEIINQVKPIISQITTTLNWKMHCCGLLDGIDSNVY